MNDGLCICAETPQLSIGTRLNVVLHRSELNKPTNTGRLAVMAITDAALHIHGERDVVLGPPPLEGCEALVLFPGPDAVPLEPRREGQPPVALFVPDGTWRQATRMMQQLPWLGAMKRVTVPLDAEPLPHRMRASLRPQAMHTGEAIAHALGVLEGPQVRDALHRAVRLMVERTLYCRGDLPAERVYGGIPGRTAGPQTALEARYTRPA